MLPCCAVSRAAISLGRRASTTVPVASTAAAAADRKERGCIRGEAGADVRFHRAGVALGGLSRGSEPAMEEGALSPSASE
jgi:hypothetical protein